MLELPDGWGRVAVHPAELCGPLKGDPRPHSRVADGRTVVWLPPPAAGCRAAIDAESVATQVPAHVTRWLGASEPDTISRWTRLEVAAKVTDIPILLLLRGAAQQEDLTAATFRLDDLIISVGWSE